MRNTFILLLPSFPNMDLKLTSIVPAVFSGILLGLSYPPYPFLGISFLALIPLIRVWERTHHPREAYLFAYLTWQVVAAVAFFWPFLHAMPNTAFGSLSGFIAYPMLLALPWPLASFIRNHQGRAAGMLALASGHVLIEWLISHGIWAMPLGLLGHTLAMAPIMLQLSNLAGVAGLSACILAVNLLASCGIQGAYAKTRTTAATLIVIGMAGYGLWSSNTIEPDDMLPVAVLQPALVPHQWSDVRDASRVDTLLARSAPVDSSTASWLLWPETALPIMDNQLPAEQIRTDLSKWAIQQGVALATGAIVEQEQDRMANSVLLFTPEGGKQRYDKLKLIPLAEYAPVPGIQVDAGGVANYYPGHTPVVLTSGTGILGPLVCYEGLFGDYARRYTQLGANWMAVFGQTGWWGPWPAPEQLIALFRIRAIESRRAVVVVTVAGPSVLILPDGTIQRLTTWMEPSLIPIQVPLHTQTTVYARLGDTPLVLFALTMFIVIALRWGWNVFQPTQRVE